MPNDFPLISVLMPVYNGGRFLPVAVQSVLNQDYPNFELVICDNGSNDDITIPYLQSILRKDPRVHVFFNESNLGPFRNIQRCYEKSSGELVVRIDADDVFGQGSLKALYAFLVANNLDIACSTIRHIDGDGNSILEGVYGNFEKDTVLSSYRDYAKLLSFRYLNQARLVRKAFLEKQGYSYFESKELGFTELSFYDDCMTGFCAASVYYYRLFGANTSEISKAVLSNKNPDNYFDAVPAFQKISDAKKRMLAEMLYLRARYPLAVIRSLNEGEEYRLGPEIRRLKTATRYSFLKMLRAIPYFSKRNRKAGWAILFRLDWLSRFVAARQLKKSLARAAAKKP